MQVASRGKDKPEFEVIAPGSYEKDHGLWVLPPPSKNDIFFDIEGYPLMEGGLEYLWGCAYFKDNKLAYKDFWGHTRDEEQQAFEDFVDWAYKRWQEDPDMHIYHYHSYETNVLKRIMCRSAKCEAEIDELLRNHVFVDLYLIVKESLFVGDDSYSLKTVERLYRGDRDSDVKDGGASMAYYFQWLTNQDGKDWKSSRILKELRDYNEDDCVSTYELTEWLRQIQKNEKVKFHDPRDEEEEDQAKESEDLTPLKDNLAKEAVARPEAILLSHLIDFHQRADKPKWWRYFHRLRQPTEELLEDKDCLAGLKLKSEVGAKGKSRVYRYLFPIQETRLDVGDKCVVPSVPDPFPVEIVEIDIEKGWVEIASRADLTALTEVNLIERNSFPYKNVKRSIREYVEKWLANPKLDDPISDLLKKSNPRIRGLQQGSILSHCKNEFEAIANLDQSLICLQGPPGAGKTTTAAEIIAKLVLEKGLRVGIASNSHKAINLLLEKAFRLISDKNPRLKAVKIQSDDDELFENEKIIWVKSGRDFDETDNPCLIGGTVFAFAHPNLAEAVDYLFIDEAGQVCLANAVAMAQATKNIVLMGDQMQLSQPIEGVHPGDSGLSVLDYYLGGHATIPDDMGIFLPTTYRLHPAICEFISEAVYEGRLKPAKGNDKQKVLLPEKGQASIPLEAGLVYIPVYHEGNSQACEEEVGAIQKIIEELMGRRFQAKDGKITKMSWNDILVVAPYNLQVNKLKAALGPEARVGTIDKFQGQQAPVCIVSMCSSDASTGRGASFLFDKNRLNVALSRAQALAIVVGHPEIGKGYVSSVEQMALLNFYCWFLERATTCQGR